MHKNNFDFLRLAFALFVVITHSYPLSGINECDILCQITNSQVSLSYIGVRGFFIISGYLIFKSLFRSKNLKDYYLKRILRLFPALIVVLLLTVLTAYFVYNSPISYWKNKDVLTYFPANLSIFGFQHSIKGTLLTNPAKSIVNGSLWTISYEFLFYILLSFLILFRKNINVVRLLLIIAIVFCFIIHFFFFEKFRYYKFLSLDGANIFPLGLFFISGSLLASLKVENFKYKNLLFILSAFIIIISVYFNNFNIFQYITLSPFIIIFGLGSTKYINNLTATIGDLSYGIYIYSFPVQQSLVYFFKLKQLPLCISSLFICIIMGYYSWHLVEKRALNFKNTI